MGKVRKQGHFEDLGASNGPSFPQEELASNLKSLSLHLGFKFQEEPGPSHLLAGKGQIG